MLRLQPMSSGQDAVDRAQALDEALLLKLVRIVEIPMIFQIWAERAAPSPRSIRALWQSDLLRAGAFKD